MAKRKTFKQGDIVEILRESWMSEFHYAPAIYDSRCDAISSREGYHRVTLPDSAPPVYMTHGLMFDEPGPGRRETRSLLIPSRRLRAARGKAGGR